MSISSFQPGNRAFHMGRLVTVLRESIVHIEEQRTGVRWWIVRFEDTGESRLINERNLCPADDTAMSAPCFKPGDRVRIPELHDSTGCLQASHCVSVEATAQHYRLWLVVLPQINSNLWVNERYLLPTGEETGE